MRRPFWQTGGRIGSVSGLLLCEGGDREPRGDVMLVHIGRDTHGERRHLLLKGDVYYILVND